MTNQPTIRRIDEDGHVAVDWPEPLAPSYLVSHELISAWADTANHIADLRHRLKQSDWIVCFEALRLLDGE